MLLSGMHITDAGVPEKFGKVTAQNPIKEVITQIMRLRGVMIDRWAQPYVANPRLNNAIHIATASPQTSGYHAEVLRQ